MNEVKLDYVDKDKISKYKNYAIQKIQHLVIEETKAGKSEDEIKELLEEIHNLIEVILKQMDYNDAHSYKGKDGKYYSDYDTMVEANRFYSESENPTIPKM